MQQPDPINNTAHDPIDGLVEIKEPEPKSFGFLLSGISLIFFLYFLVFFQSPEMYLYPSIVSGIATIIALLFTIYAPSVFIKPNRLWLLLALKLHSIFSPVLIFILFYFFIVPAGLFYRLIGVNLINKNYGKKQSTFWVVREKADQQDFNKLKKQY